MLRQTCIPGCSDRHIGWQRGQPAQDLIVWSTITLLRDPDEERHVDFALRLRTRFGSCQVCLGLNILQGADQLVGPRNSIWIAEKIIVLCQQDHPAYMMVCYQIID